jgi:hypothetical protein
MEMETLSYSYESKFLAKQVSVLEALGLDFLQAFVAMTKSKTLALAFQSQLTWAKPKPH